MHNFPLLQSTRLEVFYIVSSRLELHGQVPYQDCHQIGDWPESLTSLFVSQFPIEEVTDLLSKHVEMQRVSIYSIETSLHSFLIFTPNYSWLPGIFESL